LPLTVDSRVDVDVMVVVGSEGGGGGGGGVDVG